MNKSKSLISVITPIYNAEKYIERCVNSVTVQTYTNLEIILVDDGSKDKSGVICDKLAAADKRIKVIHKKNEGVSKARNKAIDTCTGDYVLFVDADDWLENNMIEMLYTAINEENYDIAVCGYNNYYENTNEYKEIYLEEYKEETFNVLISDDSKKYGGFPWNKLIKRGVIRHKFNENIHYYENLLFFLENCTDKLRYTVVSEPLYNYCINDTSAVHSKKYSIKKASALEALDYVIPLLPEENVVKHKFAYVCTYYENLYNIKKNKMDTSIIKKYDKNKNVYYREIKNSKELSKKQKIKLFVLFRLNFIYTLVKKMK